MQQVGDKDADFKRALTEYSLASARAEAALIVYQINGGAIKQARHANACKARDQARMEVIRLYKESHDLKD